MRNGGGEDEEKIREGKDKEKTRKSPKPKSNRHDIGAVFTSRIVKWASDKLFFSLFLSCLLCFIELFDSICIQFNIISIAIFVKEKQIYIYIVNEMHTRDRLHCINIMIKVQQVFGQEKKNREWITLAFYIFANSHLPIMIFYI